MADNDRIVPWLGATDQTINVCVRSLGESMHDGMQVAGSCGPWWTLERRYDHRSGACVGFIEPGPK